MKDTYLLDACALIAFLADEEGANNVEGILTNAKSGECKLFMHKINLLEVFYGIYREDGQEKAEEVLKKILDLPIKIINNLKNKVFQEAGRLKATYKMSLADSVLLAEAITKKIRVMTADHHEFDLIEKEEPVTFYWIR